MFTGIVKQLGIVEKININDLSGRLQIVVAEKFDKNIIVGDSIAINGVCLTASEIKDNKYYFDILSETFDKTNLGNLQVGQKVNLEPGLALGDMLGGHIVTGHIDTTGIVNSIEQIDRDWKFNFIFPKEFSDLFVMKGSIAIDGTSLTIGELEDDNFSVYIIPHTYQKTIFSSYKNGDKVNLEMDLLGKYVKRILSQGGGQLYHDKFNK